MRARAEAAAATRGRIVRAVLELHVERFHDQITLDAIADRAGVTVQTVLRQFGSAGPARGSRRRGGDERGHCAANGCADR